MQNILDALPTIMAIAGMAGSLWWLIIKEMRAIREDNKDNYHNIDKRIHGVELIVGPYAKDIATLKENQTQNMVKISEIRSAMENIKTDQERVQREIEQIRTRRA